MARAGKATWELVDLIIKKNGLPDSVKKEVRKIVKEKRMGPIQALETTLFPLCVVAGAMSKISPEKRWLVVECLVELINSNNWREELEAAVKRVGENLKRRPQ